MGKIIERLQEFMLSQGIKDNQMTVKAGLSVGLLSKAKKNNTDITGENVSRILSAYPSLSAQWLMTGTGDMLNTSADVPSSDVNIIADLLSRLQQQSEEIGRLRLFVEQMNAKS